MRRRALTAACLVAIAFAGCDRDPYQRKLPAATPTPGEVQALANGLPPEDASLLRRWGERIARGDTFVGEPTPSSVRSALRNQQEFERMAAADAAEVRRKQAEVEDARRKEDERRRLAEQQLASIAEQRQAVHAEIAKRFDGQAVSFAPQAQFDKYGRPVAQFFVFKLRFRNRTNAQVIGIAGYINLKDAFGNDLGSYPFRFEPQIRAGQTIDWDGYLTYDRTDPRHVTIKDSANLFYTWFFESIAFQDGSRIDRETIFRSSQPAPTSIGSQKKST